MSCVVEIKSSCLNLLPTFKVIPDVLCSTDLNTVIELTTTQTGKKQWYGRTTYWQESFKAEQKDQSFTIEHAKSHASNVPIDKLTMLFLQTLQDFGVSMQNRQINLEIYLDRNEVHKENSTKSGMFWHRDRVTTNNGSEIADYSMIFLLSQENAWKGGNLHLQYGGEPVTRTEFKNSDAPIVLIQPRFNQAVIFKNSDSGHMVEPIEPFAESVKRDVLIMTAQLVNK